MTTSSRTKRIFLITAIAGSCVLALFACLALGRVQEVDYPDCPFTKLPAGSACVIHTADPPPAEQKEAYDAFWAARKKIFADMKESGCEKNATPEEAAALQSLSDKKYVRAREQSETILRKNPNSLAAMFVRTSALLEGEANPAAALRQVRVMRRAVETLGRANPNDQAAREWYIRCLDSESEVMERLGDDESALRCYELLEQVFEPLPWTKTWPLLRLKRFAEVEAAIAATEQTGRWPSHVLNGRMSLYVQTNRREESFQAAAKLVEAFPTQSVFHFNRAIASCATFRFTEAEVCLQSCIKHETKNARNSGHAALAELYTQQGRLTDAREAMLAAKTQRDKREPATWQFHDGKRRAALAKLLLVAGQPVQAERLARQSVENPDRLGSTSMGAIDQQFLSDLLLYAALHDRIEVVKEAEAIDSTEFAATSRRTLETELWLIGRRIHGEVSGRRAEAAFQPHADEMPPPWLTATLLEILPTGVAAAMVEQTQVTDTHAGAAPYRTAFQAEILWRKGKYQKALTASTEALAQLPKTDEALLRARLEAIAADASFQLGYIDDSLQHFAAALNAQPAILRSLSLALPVRIETDGSDVAKRTAQMLLRSPRFVEHPQGMKIVVNSADGQVTCSLSSTDRPINVTATADPAKSSSVEQLACQSFVNKVFSSDVEINAETINRINGSPGAVREREAIGKTFNDLNTPRKK